jgi:hypothetical protein
VSARRHLLTVAATAALALAFPDFIRAQEEPVIVGQRREVDMFHIERPIYTLEVNSQYSRDRTSSQDGTVRASTLYFEEILTAETEGHVVHPNFLHLDLKGSFGLTQAFNDINGDDDTEHGTIYGWDLRGTYRRDGDMPFALYSQRTRQLTNRQFGPTLETTNTTTGAALDIRSESIPTRFDISRSVTEQSSLAGEPEYTFTRDRFQWSSSGQPAQNQRWTWNYTFSRVHQDGVIERKYDTQDAAFRHVLDFGPRQAHSLTSAITYNSQRGDFDYQRFRLDERLWLRHSRSFETKYDYIFDYNRFGTTDSARHFGAAGFTHRLYESLTTDGRIGIQRIDGDAENSTEYFADLKLDYRKRVPYGIFRLTPAASYSHREFDSTGSSIFVADQPTAFSNGIPIQIIGPNIDPGTLIVRDPITLFTYVEGIDYTVFALPDRLEVERTLGGRIPAGGPVLLSYVLPPIPESTIVSKAFSIGSRYDITRGPLQGLSVYGQYSILDQDIDTDNPAAIVSGSYRDKLVGVEYKFWDITLGAEQQWRDADVAPFDASRLFARLSTRLDPATTLSLNTSYHMIEYREPVRDLDIWVTSASLRHQFNRQFSATASALYRHQNDSFAGETTGFEQQLELEWNHRQTRIYALFRNAQLDSNFQDSSFQLFHVGLKREF